MHLQKALCFVLFLLFIVNFGTASDCHCNCDNENGTVSNLLQGPAGKRGPPGPPGDVIQCGCNSTKILKQLKSLNGQIESYKEKEALQDARTSCKQIIDEMQSPLQNGIFKLRDSFGDEYSTYCDMETDGGGWTLVASIHDNNPYNTGRCTARDRWSSEHGPSDKFPKGDQNWENMNTFGTVKLATYDDFKNPAYFELHSNDIMIWQVPNGSPIRNFSREAYLKYRTDNGFLTQYGGNLQVFFSQHFPITSRAYLFPGDRGPSIPIVFEKGSSSSLRQHLSPSLINEGLEIGFIQFRPINSARDAFALCPGFRLTSPGRYPGHGCLGSTGQTGHSSYCGDTTSYYESNPAYKTGWTADRTLIETTYFIFYR